MLLPPFTGRGYIDRHTLRLAGGPAGAVGNLRPSGCAGLLMAGTDPLVAAEYQIIVYLMIVGGGIISSLLTSTLSRPKLFTAAEQLQPWV